MKQHANFDDLIQSIQEAFIKVNNIAEAQHFEKISEYFNDDSTPKTFRISYPSLGKDGNIESTPVDVPAICLLPISSLKLNEVEVEFKVRLYGGIKLEKKEVDSEENYMLRASNKFDIDRKNTFLGCVHGGRRGSDNYANIRLKFVSDDAPEGLMRIQEQYTKISL